MSKLAKLSHVFGTCHVIVCDPRNPDADCYVLPDGYRVEEDEMGRDIVDADGVTAGVAADHLGRISVGAMDWKAGGIPYRIFLSLAGEQEGEMI